MKCCTSWHAPRADVPNSVPVTHICNVRKGHRGPCVCSCGAVMQLPYRSE